MMSLVSRLTNFYLYEGGYQTGDYLKDSQAEKRATLSIRFSLIIFSLLMTLFVIRISIEGAEKSKTLMLLPIASTIFLLFPLGIKYFNKTNLIIQTELAIGVIVIFIRTLSTGGIESPVIVWFVAIPFIASIMSIRSGIFWTCTIVVLTMLVYFSSKLGIPVNHMTPAPVVNFLILVILFIWIGALSIIYEQQRLSSETLIKQTEKKLADNKKLASLGIISGGISHEINNPLAIALGRINILNTLYKRNDLSDPEIEKGLNSTYLNLTRIETIVNALRTFSKDDFMTDFKHFNFSDIVAEVIQTFSDESGTISVKVDNKLKEKEFIINGNAALLSRVLLNLFKNSYDEVSNNVNPWIKIESIDQDNPNYLVFAVTDSGERITADNAAVMMDPFYTTKDLGKGTGLGLSLSQNILRLHLGFLKINSECKNAQFQIWLPHKQYT